MDELSEDRQSQEEEMLVLESIMQEDFSFNQPDSRDGCITCELRIPVECAEEGVEIEAWMPMDDGGQGAQADCDSGAEGGSQAVGGGKSQSQPQSGLFQRSDSGHRLLARFALMHLMPLRLVATLPARYPSTDPPLFSLSCVWLSTVQLEALSRQLATLWHESAGMPILFTWADWIQHQALQHLGLKTHLVLAPPNLEGPGTAAAADQIDGLSGAGNAAAGNAGDEEDLAQVAQCSVEDVVHLLIMHNHQKQEEAFGLAMQTCQVCYLDQPGNEFVRVPQCWHHFCRLCAEEYCRQHVREGTVQLLRCPEQQCDSTLPLEVLQSVLDEEEFKRWERLLLQRTLERMSDVEYCPRCEAPVVCDDTAPVPDDGDGGEHAQCAHCFYSFCRDCREAWHVGDCYSEFHGAPHQQQGKKKKNKKKNGAAGPAGDEDSSSDEDGDDPLAKGTSRTARSKRRQERASKEFVKKRIRCPCCRVPVVKSEGCNKMTCQCGTSFCYVCGKKGTYDHFVNGKCELFTMELREPLPPRNMQPPHEGLQRLREDMARDPQAALNRSRCPRCRRANLRRLNNNHICCCVCQQHYCHNCGLSIQGRVTAHFAAGGCPQHCRDIPAA